MADEKKERRVVDWAAVELDYRTGGLTDRALGAKHGVSHTAIQKRAKKEGWVKDLSARIRQQAEDKVAKESVAKEVASESAATERQVIEANAELLANVIRGHRSDVGRLRGVVSVLLDKVETILTESELFEQIGTICASPDDQGADKLNFLYRKVIELPSQTDTTKKLAETMKVLIELERKVFKLDAQPDDPEEAGKDIGRGIAKGVQAAMDALNERMAGFKQTP